MSLVTVAVVADFAPGTLLGVVGLAALIWLGWTAWINKDDFRITVRSGRVRFRGRFPQFHRAAAAHFLLREVSPRGTICVIGNFSPQRVLRISVQGKLSEGERQRIRNFMKLTLKG